MWPARDELSTREYIYPEVSCGVAASINLGSCKANGISKKDSRRSICDSRSPPWIMEVEVNILRIPWEMFSEADQMI